ncbi:hypothetical protein B0H21DRAFT_891712 [Amylocystis lapponica]|nr:hypothetical protein B0H21DRAFT_891712 [Amylocystis lapponica]
MPESLSGNVAAAAGNKIPPHCHTRIPGPGAPLPPRGGSASTLIMGVLTVATGLGVFWYSQQRVQGRSIHTNPSDVPTWQYRMAQQQPGAVPPTQPSGMSQREAQTPVHQPTPSASLPLPGNKKDGYAVSAVLTSIHGKGSEDAAHVEQPAGQKRMNQNGAYTKNSDYKDGYKPKA